MAWPDLTDVLITTEVRTLLGEPTARRISDTQIVRWINRGLQTICKMNLASGATATFPLAQNTFEYATGATGMTDCVAVRGVIYTGTTSEDKPLTAAKALLRMHPRHFAHIQASTAALPQEYFWHNSKMYFWPLPSAAAVEDVTVFYYKVDEDLSTGNDFNVAIPFYYHPHLIWYAYSEALMKLGKYEQAIQYRSYFDNFILYHRQNSDPFGLNVDSNDMMDLPDRTQTVSQ